MGLEQLRTRGFWKTVALAIAALVLAYVCLGLTAGLPRWGRALAGGFGFAFVGVAALAGVVLISELRGQPPRPRERQTPHGPRSASPDRDDDNGR
jgi:hypothetical protein